MKRERKMEKVNETLETIVASLGVMFIKLHHYHWFVQGPNFLVLHEKFEELYDEVNEWFDEYAERMLMRKFTPPSTMKKFLELSVIVEEGIRALPTKTILEKIIQDYRKIYGLLGELIIEGDFVLADLATQHQNIIEKHIWMLTEQSINVI
jgi:starvation-inducible DNA-binding protein